LGLAAVLALLVLELAVAIAVGRWIGAGWAVLALLALSSLGGVTIARAGTSTFAEVDARVRRGEPPGTGIADSAVLFIAGLLLVVPGFVTGVVGLLLLVPPVRALARRPLERRMLRAAADRVVFFGPASPFGPAGRRGGAVITGEVIEEEPRPDDRD
jgi:UPF0716 protein FxsA